MVDVARFGRHVGLRPLVDQCAAISDAVDRRPRLGRSWRRRAVGVARTPTWRSFDRMRIDDIQAWSLPNLLAFADRNAMAHSIETRLPFLDPHVAVLSLAMPGAVLFRDGWTKWPLRAPSGARAERQDRRGAAASAGSTFPATHGPERRFAPPSTPSLPTRTTRGASTSTPVTCAMPCRPSGSPRLPEPMTSSCACWRWSDSSWSGAREPLRSGSSSRSGRRPRAGPPTGVARSTDPARRIGTS